MSVQVPVEQTVQPLVAVRFGSFDRLPIPLGSSLSTHDQKWAPVIGREGSPFQGVRGFARFDLAGTRLSTFAEAHSGQFVVLETLRSPRFAVILESGQENGLVYSVEQSVQETRLGHELSKQGRLPMWQVAKLVSDVADALRIANEAGLAHGPIDSFSVIRTQTGDHQLGGFLPNPVNDIQTEVAHLAHLAFSAIKGSDWNEDFPNDLTLTSLIERLRGKADGLHERVARVLASGLSFPGSDANATPVDFAAAFAESIRLAAVDIAAGAWESVSRRDFAMAELLTGMLENYDPRGSELTLLRLRLQGDALRNPGITTGAIWDASRIDSTRTANPTTLGRESINLDLDQAEQVFSLGERGSTPLTPEIERLLAGPPLATNRGKHINTWAVFGIGVLVMVLIFIVLVAIGFTRMT